MSGACRRLGQGHGNRGKPWKRQLLGVKVRYEGGTWQPPARLGLKSGLSSLSDSLGPPKDDMLLVETRGPPDNRSICALEPSGCTPLLSGASTVRAGGPFSMYLSSFISKLASDFSSIQFPLLRARLCVGLWAHGGDSDLGPVLSDLSEIFQLLVPSPHSAQLHAA